MKIRNPLDDDAALHALLQEWQPQGSLPPRFRESVWRRIARAEANPARPARLMRLLVAWIASRLPHPVSASAYVAVLLLVGAGAGFSEARQEAARVNDLLGARYAQAVDPYLSAP